MKENKINEHPQRHERSLKEVQRDREKEKRDRKYVEKESQKDYRREDIIATCCLEFFVKHKC